MADRDEVRTIKPSPFERPMLYHRKRKLGSRLLEGGLLSYIDVILIIYWL